MNRVEFLNPPQVVVEKHSVGKSPQMWGDLLSSCRPHVRSILTDRFASTECCTLSGTRSPTRSRMSLLASS